LLALIGDHEQPQNRQCPGGDDAGDIQGFGGEHGCHQRADAHCPHTKQGGLRDRLLQERAELFGFMLAVVLIHDGFDGRADAVDQLAAAFGLRAGAGRQCPLRLRLPAFERACHLVPNVKVLIHQPVDQAADFSVNLFSHIRLDLCLELSFDLVGLGKVEDAGQFHGVVKVILTAIFEAVENVFHFRQARWKFGCQLAPIGLQHAFQIC